MHWTFGLKYWGDEEYGRGGENKRRFKEKRALKNFEGGEEPTLTKLF